MFLTEKYDLLEHTGKWKNTGVNLHFKKTNTK